MDALWPGHPVSVLWQAEIDLKRYENGRYSRCPGGTDASHEQHRDQGVIVMKSVKRTVLLACLAAGVASAADAPTQTTLYKSVDPGGRTVYGDRPPGDGRAAQTLKFENLPSSPLSASTLAYLEQLQKGGNTPAAAPATGELVLFTTSWCPYCKKAKSYLASKGVVFLERDIESKQGAAAYLQAGGKGGVPLLYRDGQRALGFSAPAYDTFLAKYRR
jgi:glutaredoxin